LTGAVIQATGIGKSYRLGASREGVDTLRDQLALKARRLRSLANAARASDRDGRGEIVWALRDVSFEIGRGEVVGIIGRNGAGKSTLLKILSRITAPTEGRAEIRGRVGSLLEVGTGFHPELTGRENVFLNGAIIGMRKREIRDKFDEIVDFADIPRFIDTPVKRYSSGMYIRLAFAVAAFLEPEIMLVDEVLAVGDTQFQRKCLGKMGDVARAGRTVVLISHNMGAISQLCPRAIWLDGGRVRMEGDTPAVVSSYLLETDPSAGGDTAVAFTVDEDKPAQILSARLAGEEGESRKVFTCDEPVVVELALEIRRPMPGLFGVLQITGGDGMPILVSYSYDLAPNPLEDLEDGRHPIRIAIPPRSLAAGNYRIACSIGQGERGSVVIDDPGVISSFSLNDVTTIRGNTRLGYLSTLLEWDVDVASPVVQAGQPYADA
jgi:lipopolysaccharide transport system ATP-binding protein